MEKLKIEPSATKLADLKVGKLNFQGTRLGEWNIPANKETGEPAFKLGYLQLNITGGKPPVRISARSLGWVTLSKTPIRDLVAKHGDEIVAKPTHKGELIVTKGDNDMNQLAIKGVSAQQLFA